MLSSCPLHVLLVGNLPQKVDTVRIKLDLTKHLLPPVGRVLWLLANDGIHVQEMTPLSCAQ